MRLTVSMALGRESESGNCSCAVFDSCCSSLGVVPASLAAVEAAVRSVAAVSSCSLLSEVGG